MTALWCRLVCAWKGHLWMYAMDRERNRLYLTCLRCPATSSGVKFGKGSNN
jgi:hypothetical protein